jgi:hypothetical protein
MDSDFWNLCHRLGDSLSPFILILSLNVLRTLSLSLSLVSGEPIRIFRVTPQHWVDGPAKKEQEKVLKPHWAVLGRLRNARITLAEVVGQYHARGVVPLCYSSRAVEPQTFACPSSPTGATVQPRSLRRPGDQPPSARGRVSPPLRRQVVAEEPQRRRTRDAQSPSGA